jgi:hypothetical protein
LSGVQCPCGSGGNSKMGRLRPAPTRNCHRALEWSARASNQPILRGSQQAREWHSRGSFTRQPTKRSLGAKAGGHPVPPPKAIARRRCGRVSTPAQFPEHLGCICINWPSVRYLCSVACPTAFRLMACAGPRFRKRGHGRRALSRRWPDELCWTEAAEQGRDRSGWR